MCAIIGKVYLGNGSVKRKDLVSMCDILAYRGPDDWGIYISDDKKVGLGHRRLSIIDLSRRGHQPMAYKDRYVISFNGEIYNYLDEKKKLINEGYKFRSHTDTEVILALYDKYGVKCLSHLRGFFAIVIYDKIENTLFLARDRLGKKPLKYFNNGKVFCFASELKAILSQSEVSVTPDLISINNYLTYGYIAAPFTGFSGVYKLEPGHYLLLDIGTGKLIKQKYWEPSFEEKLKLSESEWQERILSSLEESVKLRMIADVPVGAFLSGGVDSSSVVALMAKNSMERVRTFTIGFKDQKYNETKYAETISRIYNTDHQEFIVEPESVDILPELVKHYEEPYANSSNIIAYLVSKVARQHVKVILNGDCADELFGGYDRYLRVKRDAYLENIKGIASPLGGLVFMGLENIHGSKFLERGSKFFKKLGNSFESKYLSYISYFDDEEKKSLYSYDFMSKLKYYDSSQLLLNKFENSGNVSLPDKVMYFDLTTYFPDDLLTKMDIASMKVGLEARSPFIDYKMV